MRADLYSAIRQMEEEHWWYVGRRAVVFDAVSSLVRAEDRPRVLDIGCGTGATLDHLQARGVINAIGADVAADALALCRRPGRTLVQADAAAPPFRDGTFDLILALDVIEHVGDDDGALAALRALLRSNGRLIIFTPAFRFLWSAHDVASHHFRRYTRPELEQKLIRAGFAVEKLTYANTFLFPLVWLGRSVLRLLPDSRSVEVQTTLRRGLANRWLTRVFCAERPVLRRMNLPFGVSVFAVAARRS